MEPIAFDDHSGRGSLGGPGIRFVLGDEDAVRLWYGTFDAVLRLLHDLWWIERRIGRLRLLADWLADRGVFDPEATHSVIVDPVETRAALVLARDRLARRSESADELDSALVALLRCLDAAIVADEPIRVERSDVGSDDT